MAKSRDWEELVWAWREWRRVTGRRMKSNYSEFVDLHNKAARRNGKTRTQTYIWAGILVGTQRRIRRLGYGARSGVHRGGVWEDTDTYRDIH